MPPFYHPASAARAWEGTRFYARYFRWPLLFLAGALLADKLLYYGFLPLGNRIAAGGDELLARIELARGHDREALLTVRHALMRSRDSISSWKLAAKISGRLGSPEEVYCLQQIDRLEPDSFPVQARLAEAALRQGRTDAAAKALAEIAPENQETIPYLRATAGLAAALGHTEEARAWFTRLAAARPADPDSLFALAGWRAVSPQPAERAAARRELATLAASPGLALPARRLLVDLALHDGHLDEAQKWSDELLRLPGATMADRVRQLDLAAKASPAALDRALAGLMRTERPDEIVPVCAWMAAHGRAEPALIWIRSQTEEVQDDPAVGLVRADCLAALGLWEHLRDIQAADYWPGHEPERLLLLARACRVLQDEPDARAAWERALLACNDRAGYLALAGELRRIAAQNPSPAWEDARVELLSRIVGRYPDQAWAFPELLRDEIARHDSRRVEQLYREMAALDPGNEEAAAHAALLRLLLGVKVDQASATLAGLARKNPDDAVVATAEACDLDRQGRFADALGVLGGMTPPELDAPERAVYVGAALAVAGPVDRAAERLRVALAWPGLGNEERALAARAQQILLFRRTMAGLLDGTVDPAHSAAAWSALAAGSDTPGIFLVGEASARARSGDAREAARLLASVDVTALDPAGLSLYLGGVLELAGHRDEAARYLALAPDLPFTPEAAKCRRAVELWWALPQENPARLDGLFAAYRGLDAHETDPAFWRHDAPREIALVRDALLRGNAPAAAFERLHALARRGLRTTEMESLFAYALLLQGESLAARDRMELLAPAERAEPEPSLYYAVILAACGEKKAAQGPLRRALEADLPPDERRLAVETGKTL